MNKTVIAFAAGLILGLGVLLGATVAQDGKVTERYRIQSVEDHMGKWIVRLDTTTGKTDYWAKALAKEVGEHVNKWSPIADK